MEIERRKLKYIMDAADAPEEISQLAHDLGVKILKFFDENRIHPGIAISTLLNLLLQIASQSGMTRENFEGILQEVASDLGNWWGKE